MNIQRIRLQRLLEASMMSALIAVLAQMAIPLPIGVPITFQTLAVSLCAYILSPGYSVIAVALYLGLGLIGLPVFAGFRGGFPVLFGPTGGFLFGFIFLVLLAGLGNRSTNFLIKIVSGISGLFVCHFIGLLQFSYLMKMNLKTAFLAASLPFIAKDIVSVIFAAYVGNKVRRRLPFLFRHMNPIR